MKLLLESGKDIMAHARFRPRFLRRMAVVLVALFVLAITTKTGAADGGKAKSETYQNEIQLGLARRGFCRFYVEFQPVLFYLTSVQSKYRVALMRIVNDTDTPLLLSRTKDKVELRFGSRTVVGILDLSERSPEVWDGFEKSMRETLAYPGRVEKGEQEAVYVFVPGEALTDFTANRDEPTEFLYTIESLGKSIHLQRPMAAAQD